MSCPPRLLFTTIVVASGLAMAGQSAAGPEVEAPGNRLVRRDELGDPLPEGAIARLGSMRLRHISRLYSVAFSPDGKTVASLAGQTLQFWDAATGAPTGPPLSREISSVHFAFSADGKYLAAGEGHMPTRLCIWDLAERRKVLSKEAPGDMVRLAFAPDGKSLAVAGRTRTVYLIDTKDGSIRSMLTGNNQQIRAMSFSPDGKLLVAGGGTLSSYGREVMIWDVGTGEVACKLQNHDAGVTSLAFIRGGRELVVSSFDKTVRVYDVESRRQLRMINTGAYVAAASPDGKLIATINLLRLGQIWDLSDGKPVREFAPGINSIDSLIFSPDGKRLVGAGDSSGLQIWDVATGRESLLLSGHLDPVLTVAFSPDGKNLASRDRGMGTILWDPATAKEVKRFPSGQRLDRFAVTGSPSLAFSPDGTRLAAFGLRGNDCCTYVWDVRSGEVRSTLVEPRVRPDAGVEVLAVAFSPDGQVLATDGPCFWSLTTGKEIRRLKTMRCCIAFSPDGRTLAGGTSRPLSKRDQPTLILIDWKTGAVLREIPAQKRVVVSLAFSPGGHFLASCGGKWAEPDPVIQIWEPASSTLIRELNGHKGGVACVAVSPDGRLLASAGQDDNTVRVWDVFDGKELAKFEGHAGPVLSVAFSPDGKTVASGSADTTILLWDVSKLKAQPPEPIADDQALAALWHGLAGREAAKPYQAVWSLAGFGDRAVKLLAGHLRPVTGVTAEQLRRLIADLDDDDPADRESAAKKLAELGPGAEPALRRARQGEQTAEARRATGALLARLVEPGPRPDEELRQSRAVLVLELIGTDAARDLLGKLAAGAEGAPLTREAGGALDRLRRTGKR